MRSFVLIFVVVSMLLVQTVDARPPKGFHEGPYLRFIGGGVWSKFDDNQRTGERTANNWEGSYGMHFGWNLWDSCAAELEARYNTQRSRGAREHVVLANMNIKYHFITSALTNLGGFHILPYVFGGPAALISAVPGDNASSDKLLAVYGGGVGGGVGVDFLIRDYIYTGIFAQTDVFYIPVVRQNIGGVNQKIVGGWEPFISLMAALGVHF